MSHLLLEPGLGMQSCQVQRSLKVANRYRKRGREGLLQSRREWQIQRDKICALTSGGSPNLKCHFSLKIDPININSMMPSLKSY